MGLLQRLLGIGGASEAETRLAELAFVCRAKDTKPPSGELTSEQQSFLGRLGEGRVRAAAHRRAFIENMLSQAEAQGVPRALMAAQMKGPVDDVLRGWHSLGILFDWDKMDGSYGPQAFQAYFQRVDPKGLKGPVLIHFGDTIEFDTFCVILSLSRKPDDLVYIAEQFDPAFEWPGLFPHPIRFLYADPSDGHRIARDFSLPRHGEFRNGTVKLDPKAGANWIYEEAIKGTSWKMG